jgi:hypothetical protein
MLWFNVFLSHQLLTLSLNRNNNDAKRKNVFHKHWLINLLISDHTSLVEKLSKLKVEVYNITNHLYQFIFYK